MLLKTFTRCLACFISTAAFSQVIDNAASYRIVDTERYIRFQYDNDYFVDSDQYYTQGMNLEFVSRALNKNPLTRFLITPKANINQVGLAIEHNAYTPTSISFNEIRYGDRPFAASVMIKIFGASVNKSKHYRITSSLSIGMIGPVAGAYQLQKTIHGWINGTDPQGWQYQIKNDLLINYEVGYEKNIVNLNHVLLNGYVASRLGTYNTKFSLGSTFMFGKLNSAITRAFSQIASTTQRQKFTYHFYVQPSVNTVAYDATLNGGMVFNRHSLYTLTNKEIERFTFQGNAGVVFSISSVYIEYFQSILSKEFNAGGYHRWGGLKIGVVL
jgi:hypothetical protein